MYRGLWNLITKYLDNSHAVSVFLPVIIDQPISDPGGSKTKERPLFLPVGQNGFVESEHGYAELVIVAFPGDALDKLCGF